MDMCYTNHAEADQDDMNTLLKLLEAGYTEAFGRFQNDMNTLLKLLGVASCTYLMGVPGADDIMLGYQSTSFHDALGAGRAGPRGPGR